MSKVKVLFFAADPLSVSTSGSPRLLLDEEVRQIRRRIEAAKYRDELDLDVRWATRAKDMVFALNQTHPHVVHFSGHGGPNGLVLAGLSGRSGHSVDAAALTRLFEVFRGDIRVVVLNACFSLPQAKAIAAVVGCAIGTHHTISDEAAITFGATFYQAVAFGHSVKVAFDQARSALDLDHHDDRECPELVVGPGVDAAQLVLIAPEGAVAGGRESAEAPPPGPMSLFASPAKSSPRGQGSRWTRVAGAALVLSTGTVLTRAILKGGEPPATVAECTPTETVRSLAALPDSVAVSMAPGNSSGREAEVAAARDLYEARNYAAAFPIIQRAAAAGNAEAMGFLGIMYLRGQGTARDTVRALELLRNAGDKRDVRGMKALAEVYRGDTVSRNNYLVPYWYRLAAEGGDAEAMRELGSMYLQGKEVDRNDRLAREWLEEAMRMGSVDAMVDIAWMHEKGLGTPASNKRAFRCYRTAAEAGSARGLFALGQAYENGVGVRADTAEAAGLYRKAADAGSADAMNNLGVLFLRGRGVPADTPQAITLFRQAAATGSTIAAGNLAKLGFH
ncbi:MAG TPA: CHAT domain-containing protein [Longimicrobium sp.]|nr:CHAT domain-containing protein [Longimicrobium sp.]